MGGSSRYGKQNLYSTRSGEVHIVKINKTCVPPGQEYKFSPLMVNITCAPPVQEGFQEGEGTCEC